MYAYRIAVHHLTATYFDMCHSKTLNVQSYFWHIFSSARFTGLSLWVIHTWQHADSSHMFTVWIPLHNNIMVYVMKQNYLETKMSFSFIGHVCLPVVRPCLPAHFHSVSSSLLVWIWSHWAFVWEGIFYLSNQWIEGGAVNAGRHKLAYKKTSQFDMFFFLKR